MGGAGGGPVRSGGGASGAARCWWRQWTFGARGCAVAPVISAEDEGDSGEVRAAH